jgi:hypothetical protein
MRILKNEVVCAESNLPEQLGDCLRRRTGQVGEDWHASATWGVTVEQLWSARIWGSSLGLARLAGPVRWARPAVKRHLAAPLLNKSRADGSL